jgi:tRNA U34 5-methylaminomethyl-2-thiouridine-forming methyltransferase MnmC
LNRDVIITDDGSSTVYNKELDECYHSTHGAISESLHVFIRNGLQQINLTEINVFEIGFGTGLNAFLSAIYADDHKIRINYATIEKFPLEATLVDKLNYSQNLGFPEIFKAIHFASWNRTKQITPFFELLKLNQDFIKFDFNLIVKPDIIFFDAFSPSKQAEIWQPILFEKLYNLLNINGTLVTYAAAGLVKNALRQVGFQVKRLKGPPGKHHMISAKKI